MSLRHGVQTIAAFYDDAVNSELVQQTSGHQSDGSRADDQDIGA